MKKDFLARCQGRSVLLATVLLAGVAGSYVNGASFLVNVDFGSGFTYTKVGPAATGLSGSDFWNFYTRDDGKGGWLTVGALTNLKQADGTACSVGFTLTNAPGCWANSSSDPMYASYVYPLNAQPAVFTVTNLPTGNYDFYLYGEDASFQLVAGAVDYGTKATAHTNIVNPVVWQENVQYVLVRNVAVTTGQAVTVTVRPGVDGVARLCGFQIATATPQPPVATLINANFGGGTFVFTKVGRAAVGMTDSDFWNAYTRDDGHGGWLSVGALANLKFADGTPSSAGFILSNAPGAWGNASSDPMYSSYVYPLNNQPATLTITNLPTGHYDFYLYGEDSSFQLVTGGVDYGTKATAFTSIVNPVIWQENIQYILVPNVAVTNGQIVAVTVRPGVNGVARLCGLQILQVVAPRILTQPSSQVGYWGKSVSFNVKAAGDQPLQYQWFFNGASLAWGTNSTLNLSNLELGNAGSYRVKVTDKNGASVFSDSISLLVNPAGISLGMYAGLTIDGAVGKTFGIQYSTDITATNSWTALTNITLTQPVQLWIDTSVNAADGTQPRRFYRVVAIP